MTVYYAIFPDGRHAFTHEQRIADAWGGAGVAIFVDPVDTQGDAFTGLASQTITASTDEESGAVTIDVEQHPDIATASAVIADRDSETPAPPTTLPLEVDNVTARVAELETSLASILAWARALSHVAAA